MRKSTIQVIHHLAMVATARSKMDPWHPDEDYLLERSQAAFSHDSYCNRRSLLQLSSGYSDVCLEE
jgi:hypothetical protein